MMVVVDIIVNCHMPKAGVGHVWPVKSGMYHYSADFCEDCLDSTFGSSILMMSPDATELYVLKALFNFIDEGSSSKRFCCQTGRIEQLHSCPPFIFHSIAWQGQFL